MNKTVPFLLVSHTSEPVFVSLLPVRLIFPLCKLPHMNASRITSVGVIPSPRLRLLLSCLFRNLGPENCIPSTMLAINTQLSGLIMWNCGKFTWGSGTNDIRVWPCFSEMAPAPAAGTRRLPKKIWSHSPPPPESTYFLAALPPFSLPTLFSISTLFCS